MRTLPRVFLAAAAAGLLSVGLAPASYASSSPQVPADCTLAAAGVDGLKLTCTARPATQTWHLAIYCTYWVRPSVVPGNRVTGNGTPEAHCLFGFEPDGGNFVIDS